MPSALTPHGFQALTPHGFQHFAARKSTPHHAYRVSKSGALDSLSITLSLSLTLLQPPWPLHYFSNVAGLSRMCTLFIPSAWEYPHSCSLKSASCLYSNVTSSRNLPWPYDLNPPLTPSSLSVFVFPCTPYHLLELYIYIYVAYCLHKLQEKNEIFVCFIHGFVHCSQTVLGT